MFLKVFFLTFFEFWRSIPELYFWSWKSWPLQRESWRQPARPTPAASTMPIHKQAPDFSSRLSFDIKLPSFADMDLEDAVDSPWGGMQYQSSRQINWRKDIDSSRCALAHNNHPSYRNPGFWRAGWYVFITLEVVISNNWQQKRQSRSQYKI
jgi:hypothetical protein